MESNGIGKFQSTDPDQPTQAIEKILKSYIVFQIKKAFSNSILIADGSIDSDRFQRTVPNRRTREFQNGSLALYNGHQLQDIENIRMKDQDDRMMS